jgi:hypothetical protein
MEAFIVSNKNIPVHSTVNSVPVTLMVKNAVIPAIFYDNPSARDLFSKLPHKVRLSRFKSGNYCGSMRTEITFDESDAQNGYWNGEIAYWTLGDGFVIFFENEEQSLSVGVEPDFIMLGRLADASCLEIMRGFDSPIEMTIECAQNSSIYQ